MAKYQYGAPVVNKLVEVVFSGGLRKVGRTDGAGKFHVEFSTDEFAEEQTLQIVATLVDENVAAVADVALAIRAFQIRLSTTRDTYLDGESFALKVDASDALGKPIGQPLTVAVVKRIVRNGEVSERQVSEQAIVTDAEDGRVLGAGQGRRPRRRPLRPPRLRARTASATSIVADLVLTISGKADEMKLRLLADRLTYKVGETAKVNLHSRVPAGPALIAWEADRVIQYRIVDLKEGDNPLTWAVEGPQFPNFTLTAARMSAERFDEARLDVRVERDLRVTLAPKRADGRPGRGGRGRGDDRRPARPARRRRAVAGAGRPLAPAALRRPDAADRPVLLQPDPHRGLRDRLDEPLPLRACRRCRSPRPSSRRPSGSRRSPRTTKLGHEARKQAEAGAVVAMDAANGDDESVGLGMGGMRRSHSPGPRADGGARPCPARAGGRWWRAAPGTESALAPRRAALERRRSVGDRRRCSRRRRRAGRRIERPGGSWRTGWPGRRSGGRTTASRTSEAAEPRRPASGSSRRPTGTPSVVTGADGKATVKLKAPGAMSEYRFTARGVTGADTLVGQATAELVVRKDFFVDLKAPSALAQGDKPRFIGQVHHLGVAGEAAVTLTVYAGGRQDDVPQDPDAQGRRRRRGRLRPDHRARGGRRPAHAQGAGRRAVGRADAGGPGPPVGRAGVRLGVGDVERRRDGLRRPAAGAGV